MKKFLAVLLLIAAALWGAEQMGYIKLPLFGQAVETAQRAFGRGRRPQSKTEEIPVLTETVRREDVPVTADTVGTVQALNTVVVRAQVDGRLMELDFKDGQDVKKGDVLARIDPRTYQAQYDQVVAKKAQDEAQLANARIDLDRYNKLATGNFGSRQQADTQKAMVAQLEAQVRLDQAAIDNARAILDYTNVVAPIDGRTGLRAVDAGNIVHAADLTGLVTITQINPIATLFNLPQQQLRAVNAAKAKGPVTVQALEPDNTTVIDTGTIDVVDNLVDITTGTVRIKASFPNAGQRLWPGQFVNVRLFIDVLPQATVVASAAIQRGPKGPFVYVVSDDNKAVMTPVTITRQDEQRAVIASGVAPPARVVTTGFGQLTDGTLVRPAPADAGPVASAAAPLPGADRPDAPRPPAGNAGSGDRRQSGQQGGRRAGGGQGGRAPAPQGDAPAPGAAPARPSPISQPVQTRPTTTEAGSPTATQ